MSGNKKIINSNSSSDLYKKNNVLSGLLAHYNSDSETEESAECNKLDVKVDSFLQELNKMKSSDTSADTINSWQECFDVSTGYPYYWNVETNQVTWEKPDTYKSYSEKSAVLDQINLRDSNVHVDKTKNLVKDSKSDKSENVLNITTTDVGNNIIKNAKKIEKKDKPKKLKHVKKKEKKISEDSEDEKIVMITSFCEDTSEEENENLKKSTPVCEEGDSKEKNKEKPLQVLGSYVEQVPKEEQQSTLLNKENKKEIIECVKEELDEKVILARLRTQVKVLQELDGELPESVDKLLNNLNKKDKTPSLSLVAGYGDDSDVEDDTVTEETPKSLFPIETSEPIISPSESESVLFPITKPINIDQFPLPEDETSTPKVQTPDTVDTKVFKRKKRIAFDVLPTKVEKKVTEESNVTEKETEYKTQTNVSKFHTKNFINFRKAGVAFVKSDTLEPPVPTQKTEIDNEKKFEIIKEIVNEKVNFLCEGKSGVSAVQIMSIQLETLEAAFKAGGLSETYLYSWLCETDSELAKLEKDAAPDGWLCQWDRLNKRYYYKNEQTKETQWNYPEQDIIGGGEAMDICTTPPALDDAAKSHVDPVPPPPPSITMKSPTPPPPPAIVTDSEENINKEEYQLPLPGVALILNTAPPPPPAISLAIDQPLPPGVDHVEQPYVTTKSDTITNDSKGDAFGSELDSFYSDIAMIEATTVSNLSSESKIPECIAPPQLTETDQSGEPPKKKKKKSKVKIHQGVTMKKKAVSTLVEKWRKVQNDYI